MTDEPKPRKGRGPKPTPQTTRRLFAEQIGCARPGCPKPLYSDIDGKQLQTCEVAHICSYATDGPRHDPSLTADQTREFSNLILLCKDCHDLVDEYHLDYPASMLVEWKAEQKQKASDGGGHYLTDDEVRAALAAFETPGASTHVAEVARKLELVRAAVRDLAGKFRAILEQRQAEIDSLNRRTFVFDSESGEKLSVSLSVATEQKYRNQAQSAVDATAPDFETACTDLRVEVAAAAAATDRVPTDYVDWLTDEISGLTNRYKVGDVLGEDPCSSLAVCVGSITDLIKGVEVRASPPVPDEPEPPTEAELAANALRELRDRTAPHLRASNRPFDEQDAAAIVEVLPLAIGLQSEHDFSVRSFMYRLVAMLKTATDEQIAGITDSIRGMPDGVIAEFVQIATVEDIGFRLNEREAEGLRSYLVDRLEATATDLAYWRSNDRLMSQVLRHHAIYVDPDSTAALIQPMLEAYEDLCFEVLRWFALVDMNGGSPFFMAGIGPPLPPFVPVEPVIAAVLSRHPDLAGLGEFEARAIEDPERRLAATFLVAAGM